MENFQKKRIGNVGRWREHGRRRLVVIFTLDAAASLDMLKKHVQKKFLKYSFFNLFLYTFRHRLPLCNFKYILYALFHIFL